MLGFKSTKTLSVDGENEIYTQFNYKPIIEVNQVSWVAIGRWLDKACIVEEEITGRLCTVAQVKQVKWLLRIGPIWTIFVVVYGLVEATGRTFFIEQANNLDDNIGNLFIVPVTLLITLKSLVRFVVSFLLQYLITPKRLINRAERQRFILVRIGLGMFFSTLSCTAAWQVEFHRLNSINKKQTLMSIIWSAPQFILLGLMAGFAEDGLKDLHYNSYYVAEESNYKHYESSPMDCTLDIGNFLCIFAFIFRAWFGNNINDSRLDKYFLMLARFAIGNICVYCVIALVSYRIWWEEEAQQQENVNLNHVCSLEDALTVLQFQ